MKKNHLLNLANEILIVQRMICEMIKNISHLHNNDKKRDFKRVLEYKQYLLKYSHNLHIVWWIKTCLWKNSFWNSAFEWSLGRREQSFIDCLYSEKEEFEYWRWLTVFNYSSFFTFLKSRSITFLSYVLQMGTSKRKGKNDPQIELFLNFRNQSMTTSNTAKGNPKENL